MLTFNFGTFASAKDQACSFLDGLLEEYPTPCPNLLWSNIEISGRPSWSIRWLDLLDELAYTMGSSQNAEGLIIYTLPHGSYIFLYLQLTQKSPRVWEVQWIALLGRGLALMAFQHFMNVPSCHHEADFPTHENQGKIFTENILVKLTKSIHLD